MNDEAVKIIVVDDIEQNLLAMEATLSSDEVEVLVASSGLQALELLLEHEVALVIVDVQMPQMDGYTLAELMRGAERTRHVPVVFLTASSQEEWRSFRGYEAGAVDFLYKPIDIRVMRGKVAVFVELFRQRQSLRQRMAELERLGRINASMIAALSHDIRAPLAALALNSQLLLRRPEARAVEQAGARIKALTATLNRQVDHLVNLAQQPSGKLHPSMAWGDVAALVRSRLEEGQYSSAVNGTFSFECEGDPSVEFDATLLAQAIDYLLLQAATHSADTDVTVRLDGNARRFVLLRVCFDAQLPASASRHMFGDGLALEGVSTPRVGPGLDFPERIARAHAGSLIGRSNAADGTLFELMLPRGLGH